MAQPKPASPSRLADQLLRAVAICGVITIHFMAMFHKSPFVTGAPYQFWAVSLDQLARLSVPLFVALSGYGLSQKYSRSEFHWGEFVKNRLLKLLPLYIGWSIFYYFILRAVPLWNPTWQTSSLLDQIIWGQADYQMYFVPMIFQLYLLFPLLFMLRKKWPVPTLLTFAVVQIFCFWLYQEKTIKLTDIIFTDQLQYIFCGTWIFYFVLGMYLPRLHSLIRKLVFGKALLLTVVLLGTYLMISNALYNVNHGIDPIIAQRFTRFTVLLYASSAIVLSTWLALKIKRLPRVVEQLGIHSYSIYLAHTFLLRVIFSVGILK